MGGRSNHRVMTMWILLAAGAVQAAVPPRQVLNNLDLTPALFIENQGQWTESGMYYIHNGGAFDVAMTDSGLTFQFAGQGSSMVAVPTAAGGQANSPQSGQGHPPRGSLRRFSMSFVGSNLVRPAGLQRAPTTFHYCTGDPRTWKTRVPSYEAVLYRRLYEGIDLRVQGLRSHLKYEFHVAPNADYRLIAVHYEGIEGLSIAEDGSLLVAVGPDGGTIRDEAPFIYQEIDGRRHSLPGRFVLRDARTYSFEILGEPRPDHAIVIDPNLSWGSYLGGLSDEAATDVAVDGQGNIYVTGWTDSPDWTVGGFDTVHGGDADAFVAKLSPAGSHLWTTYLGGDSWDSAADIAVDAQGYVYVTGSTMSAGWISGGFDTQFDQGTTVAEDAFAVKLTAEGVHVWSTYLGRATRDVGEGIAVDAQGNVYVTGTTSTPAWVSGGYDASYNGGISDAFVVKLTGAGGHDWSSYLGGALEESGVHVAVDANGDVYVAGQSKSPDWLAYGFDTTHNGDYDAFVVRLSGESQFLWGTYLGGAGSDYATGITVDNLTGVYVTGLTSSAGWVSGGPDPDLDGAPDGFLVKLSDSGSHLWSTYLGGADSDVAADAVCDGAGNVYVAGHVSAAAGVVPAAWVSGGFNLAYNGGESDGFVATFTGAGAALWSSFLGAPGADRATGIAVDGAGSITVVGETASTDWLRGGFDESQNGRADAFVVQIDDTAPTEAVRCPVYQFWSEVTQRHFYTASESERRYLLRDFPHIWAEQGIAWYALANGADPNSLPVYRFWSDKLTDHFYTIGEQEKDVLVREYEYVWLFEGPAFYAYPEGSQPPDTMPVYRFFSPPDGTHYYTTNEAEKDDLIRNGSADWTYECIAFYVYPP